MKKIIRRTASAAAAIAVLAGTAMPDTAYLLPAGTAVTAHAEDAATASFNETTGVLTLSGNVIREDVTAYAKNEAVLSVAAAPGTVLPAECGDLFANFTAAVSIDLSNADSSGTTDMSSMFYNCKKLTSLNLSGLDTSNVRSIGGMFMQCASLTTLDLSGFRTSNVAKMSHAFKSCHALTDLNLSGFDTSNVTEMTAMFNDCDALTVLHLDSFDTANVTDMENMFKGCKALKTIAVSGSWSMESVKNGSGMFQDCEQLVGGNGNLYRKLKTGTESAVIDTFAHPGYLTDAAGSLTPAPITDCTFDESTGTLTLAGEVNVSHVQLYAGKQEVLAVKAEAGTVFPADCSRMFENIKAESMDLSGADTSGVTDMSFLFSSCGRLTSLTLAGWDTANVTKMNSMFSGCKLLTALDLTHFNTAAVTDLNAMFATCESLTALDVTHFDTAKAFNMTGMFRGCAKLTELDVTHFDTEHVQHFSGMFLGCKALTALDLTNFRTPHAVGMNSMFENCAALTALDLTHFDTTRVQNMTGMFRGCSGLTELDLASFRTDSLAAITGMFCGCSALRTIRVSANWDTSGMASPASSSYKSMFTDCTQLVGGNGTAFDSTHDAADYLCVDTAETPGYLTLGDGSVQPPAPVFGARLDEATGTLTLFGEFHTDNVTKYKQNDAVRKVVVAEGTVFPENCAFLFQDFSVETIDLTNADTSHVTDMRAMFSGCKNLTALNLGGIDTSNVTAMEGMFQNCASLPALDVSGLNTSRITSMAQMFEGCKALTSLDLTALDTSNVTDMHSLTAFDSALTELKLTGLNTAKVEKMYMMCTDNTALTKADLSGLNTQNVFDMNSMFSGCTALTEAKFSGVSTEKVISMVAMFKNCAALEELDLASFRTAKVQDMSDMFRNCAALKTIRVSDGWDLSGIKGDYQVFTGAEQLTGGNGTVYDASKVRYEYARIDRPGTPGYLTGTDEAVPHTEPLRGDFSGDGELSVDDAQMVLAAYTEMFAGNPVEMTDAQRTAADVNNDGAITVEDAQCILKYYTEKFVAGNDVTWDDVIG